MAASWLQEKVSARVHARGLSLKKFSMMFGTIYSTFINRLSDPMTFSVAELQKMTEILGVTESWLRNGRIDDVMDGYSEWNTDNWQKEKERMYD